MITKHSDVHLFIEVMFDEIIANREGSTYMPSSTDIFTRD